MTSIIKHLHLPAIFCCLIFISSCTGQNKSHSKETTVTTAPPTIDLLDSEDNWKNQLYIYPKEEGAKPTANAKIDEYVREVFQDSKGNLWFGTISKGVARYDGTVLTYFGIKEGLIGNQINGIAEDDNGHLWFSTTRGVSVYDGKYFINFTEANGLSDNSTWCITADSKGQIWVGTVKGVCRYDGKSFVPFPLPEAKLEHTSPIFSSSLAWDIKEDARGNLWFGMDGVGVVRYDGANFTHFTQKEGLNTNVVFSILSDTKGNIWFGCRGARDYRRKGRFAKGGLCKWDGTTFTKFPEIHGLIAKDVGPIYEDKSGNIWLASKHNGIYKYNGEVFTNFLEKEGIAPYNCAQSILEDTNGQMWFGFSGGLFRLEKGELRHITTDGPWE